MPEGADPMDVRYNTITWVHRSTRGWSYGNSISDPRTGEIIKGHVTLGSMRMRQDYMILEGLLSPYTDGDGEADADYRSRARAAAAVVRARSRPHDRPRPQLLQQLEGPHFGARLSAPLITLRADGTMDLSQAYDGGDRPVGQGLDPVRLLALCARHRTRPPRCRKILDDAWTQDLRYMTNQDLDGQRQRRSVEQRHGRRRGDRRA